MKKRQIWAAILVLVVGSSYFYGASIANSPNEDLTFVRTMPSKLNAEYIDKVFQQINTWPDWFFSAEKADQVDFRGIAYPIRDQKLVNGAVIKIHFDAKKGPRHRFDLMVQVVEYIPRQKLHLHVLSDTQGKLAQLFSSLDWTLELLPQGPQSEGAQHSAPESAQNGSPALLIRGTEIAHTASARARLLGHLIPSIFLNQTFYPNLQNLAEINNPELVHPFPADMQ